ncbi:MAG TPA: YfhO family protein, partial [Chthoniobacterales bacterium]
GDYYRTYSLFSVLGLVTLSMIALRRYLERESFSLLLLAAWTALLIGVLLLPFEALRALIDPRLRMFVIVYLVLDTAILFAGRLMNKQTVAVYALLAVTTIELVHFNRITVADRQVVQKSELIEGFAANRETFQAVADLKRDDPSFHRLTRLRSGEQGAEIDSNDAMLLNYYSTASYGSFNDFNYIRFLAAIEAIPSYRETDTRWTVGLAGNFIPSIFAGEKYVLVEDPEPFQRAAQYEWIRDYGKSHLFRNALSLPFGLGFARYLPEDEFLQLPRDDKEQVLLATAVLETSSAPIAQGLKQTSPAELGQELVASSVPALVQQRRATALYLNSFAQNRITGDLRLDQNGILILQMPFNRGWHAYQDNEPVPVVRADAGLLGIPIKAGEHRIELRYRNPWLVPGAIVSGVAFLLLALCLWRKPRLAVSLA